MNQTPTPIPPDNLFAMAAATAHADREHEGWSEKALAFLKRYAAEHADGFTAEQCIAAATAQGLTTEDARAWGSVFNGASRRREIVRAGFVPRVLNGSPTSLWKPRT